MSVLIMKYQQYEEYKESGIEWVGNIPSHWEETPVFSCFDATSEKNLDGKEANVLSLSYGNIIKRDVDTNFGLLPESFNTYQIVDVGDIILRLTDLQNDKRSLRVGLAKEKGIITSAYLKLKPKDRLDSVFAYRLLHSYDTTKVYYGLGGGLRQSMKFEDFRRLPILVPPYEEQIQINRFLDYEVVRIDTLIEKQQTLIQLLKEKRQAVISHAVTKGLNPEAPMKDSGVEWLGEVPEHWTVSFVKYIVLGAKDSMVDGPFGSSVNTSEDYVDDGIPVIRTVNITNNGFSSDNLKFMRQQKFEQLKRHSVKPGDVLFSKVGTIGNACLLPNDIPEAILSTTGSCKISVDQNKIEGEYLVLMFHLMNQTLMEMANSNVQPFLNMSNIKNLKISLPSIEEQKNILTYLEEKLEGIDDLIAKSLSFDKLIRERRTALISAAVTGKIDVRGWQVAD